MFDKKLQVDIQSIFKKYNSCYIKKGIYEEMNVIINKIITCIHNENIINSKIINDVLYNCSCPKKRISIFENAEKYFNFIAFFNK